MTETQGKSLQQVMNEMVKRLDTVCCGVAEQQSRTAQLSELDIFISLDPILANLNRQYLEAKNQRVGLTDLHGKEDAMVEVALDMEDSAWCAMETRLLELRQNGELMRYVQSMMRQAQQTRMEEVENILREGLEKQHRKLLEWTRIVQRLRGKNKVPVIFEWAALMLMFNIVPFNRSPYSDFQTRFAA